MDKILHTKFGNAKNYNDTYYMITSNKEGNYGKLLHRLIWEDFYGCEVPDGYVIHHKNGNKLDNCILNLQLLSISDHQKLHTIGKYQSDKRKINRSKSTNTTGFFRVSKRKDKRYKQGFIWIYSGFENSKRKVITSTSIDKLEAKVRAKGLKWKKLDKEV